MSFETFSKGSQVFFSLLKEKVLTEEHESFELYFEEGVREAVAVLTLKSRTQIIETPKKIHLVAKASGSVFATNFTHLKEKYREVDTKKLFHVLTIINMTFLAYVDRNDAHKIRSNREGMTVYALERSVSSLANTWSTLLREEEGLGRDYRVDMKQVVDIWSTMELEDRFEREGAKRGNKRTRIGLILTAIKLLEDEGLVMVLDKEDIPRIFPKDILFDRIDFLYHDFERYQELKKLMFRENDDYA
jgi:hypothetical protein